MRVSLEIEAFPELRVDGDLAPPPRDLLRARKIGRTEMAEDAEEELVEVPQRREGAASGGRRT